MFMLVSNHLDYYFFKKLKLLRLSGTTKSFVDYRSWIGT